MKKKLICAECVKEIRIGEWYTGKFENYILGLGHKEKRYHVRCIK